MRFLSKVILLILILTASVSATFLMAPISNWKDINEELSINNCMIENVNVDSNWCQFSNADKNLDKQKDISESTDNTIFNLTYEGKIWTFKAEDFRINSNIFTLDLRANNYNRSGSKENKIELLNKLIKINIEPEIAFNYIYLGFNKNIDKIKKNIEKLPKNAEIKLNNNNFKIFNEIIGIKLNKDLFYSNLINLYKNNQIVNMEIPVIKNKPNITRNDLEKELNKRSEFTTSIATSSSGRKHNIKKALSMINGKKLIKGEKFSFNKCVGRRTSDNGFKQAKIILDGEFVEGFGGGVCQVSSTLYNSALLAGLNILSSQKHSQKVGYVKAGFDAMVNYGSSDLVFENNTEGNIYILCKYTNERITITIYGCSLNGISYTRENEIINPISPKEDKVIYDNDGKYADKVTYDDESFVLKASREGYTVKSYRLKYLNGELMEKELLRTDKYPAQQGEIVFGVKVRPQQPNTSMLENILQLQ